LNPDKAAGQVEVEVHLTKRRTVQRMVDRQSVEREVRTLLARKISGTLLGLWLLIPEYLTLGIWDLVRGWSRDAAGGLHARLALQLINEAALCVNGVRAARSLTHQGFEVANGLPYLATDTALHTLLDAHTIREAQHLQVGLGWLRRNQGHYRGRLVVCDPHRIPTYSRRIMPYKKSNPRTPSQRVLQTFFAVDGETGQPFAFTIGSSGRTTTRATREVLALVEQILAPEKNVLVIADTEHSSRKLLDYLAAHPTYAFLSPLAKTKTVTNLLRKLPYQRQWAGYALAEIPYRFRNSRYTYRLIGQRSGEQETGYVYKPFVATGDFPALEAVSEQYPERWTVEEFFNFEGALGWNRAATLNLNIRYGKLSLALIAQAATYQLKQKLPPPFKKWTAKHLAYELFRGIDGDLRVKNDTIIATLYNAPETAHLQRYYKNLPAKLESQGIDPRIPWLFNFKLDFRFK
jgi:hypothetical protein